MSQYPRSGRSGDGHAISAIAVTYIGIVWINLSLHTVFVQRKSVKYGCWCGLLVRGVQPIVGMVINGKALPSSDAPTNRSAEFPSGAVPAQRAPCSREYSRKSNHCGVVHIDLPVVSRSPTATPAINAIANLRISCSVAVSNIENQRLNSARFLSYQCSPRLAQRVPSLAQAQRRKSGSASSPTPR